MNIITEVKPGLFQLEVPLPQSPLKVLNSYVIKGPERNLIIDTGFNHPDSLSGMLAGLQELAVDRTATDFFITHLHADHSGLISHLATPSSRVYCSPADAEKINRSNDWYEWLAYACRNGFPPLYEAVTMHPFFRHCSHRWVDFTLVREGDRIDVGDYQFECVAAPGHTPGLMCLYERQQRLFAGGDLILAKITPNIQSFEEAGNPLRDYLRSLDKIRNLEIDVLLPGHRRLITDHRARIDELKQHHHNRSQEIIRILAEGAQNAYQIATQMDWDLSYEYWEDFPVLQKWFAIGEVIAHLQYLEPQGLVQSLWRNNQIQYALS